MKNNEQNCIDAKCKFYNTRMELNCSYGEDNSACWKQEGDNGIKPHVMRWTREIKRRWF